MVWEFSSHGSNWLRIIFNIVVMFSFFWDILLIVVVRTKTKTKTKTKLFLLFIYNFPFNSVHKPYNVRILLKSLKYSIKGGYRKTIS